MPKQPTGQVRWRGGVAIARITIAGDDRPSFAMPTCTDAAAAAERAQVLADVARRLRGVVGADQAREVLKQVARASERSLPVALEVVGQIAGGKVRPKGAPTLPTFKQLGERWTKGELAELYPDQVKVKRTAETDKSRLERHVYPVIGPLPVDQVTLDKCEEVMRKLPAKLEPATRRHIGGLIARVLTMAVYPLRLIASSPIPRGFLPSSTSRKALGYLYPDEDRRLMACTAVPLELRLLWGFFAREGMREGEALALSWSELDLDRGAVRLDKNKTDDPRAWALDAGVAAALRRYRDQNRHADEPGALVFVDPNGAALTKNELPETLRAHLEAIGLKDERPELFAKTDERIPMRVHDLRGTFVTIALANGKSEAWISDRTGHRSSQMIARYKRTARTFAELNQGQLTPLCDALPELAIGHGLGTERRSAETSGAQPVDIAGGSSRSRTEGQWIKNPLLYQLS